MTAAQFNAWLAAMKTAGLARSDAECARLLGVSKVTVGTMRRTGVIGSASRRTALACRALLHRLEPWE